MYAIKMVIGKDIQREKIIHNISVPLSNSIQILQ